MKLVDLFEIESTTLSKTVSGHIQHPEDLLFDDGVEGAKRAVEELAALEHKSETITIKWDGFPGIIFGRDARGNLIISDKHMFRRANKETGERIGLSKSSDEFENYDKNRGADRTDLYGKEKVLRSKLENMIPNNSSNRDKFYFGDLLWAGQLSPIDGYYTFTPNTVTYKVKEDSDLGKKIANSKGGIAVHSFIPGINKEDEPLKGIGKLPIDGPIVFLSGEMIEKPSVVIDTDMINRARTIVNHNSPAAKKFIQMITDAKVKSMITAMKTFITAKIKEGDFNNLAQDFLHYLPEKLTSDSAKRNAATLLSSKDGKKGLSAIWAIWLAITNLKIAVKKQIDAKQTDPNIPVQAFTGDEQGHEGYVFGIGRDKLKIVDRLSFSKANFAKTRTDSSELVKRSEMPIVAFCFGRMNPPTVAHELLMDNTAKIGGPNTFIFLSATQNAKTDPLPYNTKVAFAKRMFPKHANQIVNESVLNPIYAANYLYKKGFRNLTFVAGSDRLGDGPGSLEKVLKNWNSGPIRTTDNTINNREEVILKFVSSGERDPDSQGVEGYSASKAREAAANNNKNEFYRFTGANDNIKINNETLFTAVRKGMGLTLNEFQESDGTIAMLRLEEKCANIVKAWCDKHNIECIDPTEMHCTILYSKQPVPELLKLNDRPLFVSADIIGWRKLGSALVFELDCNGAVQLHEWMMSKGGTHDFPEFIAHTTISYDWEDDDLPKILPNMKLEFDKLEVNKIDPDYVDNLDDD